MPRYIIERTFPNGVGIAKRCHDIVERNSDHRVTWVHSYVSEDGRKMFCVYDGPTPEAIRKTAVLNDLPLDRITQVRVLDPYFYA